jgi:tetratricopeptide (TPR) repeat protein
VALVLAGSFVCWPVRAPTDGIRFDAEQHKNVGVGLQVRGLAAEALIQYELALALGPACEEAHYYQGTALRDVGRKAEAAGSFRRCLALRPDHAKAADDLAVLIVQQGGDLDEAERLLRGVLARDPNNARVQRNLGVLLAKRGRTAEAQEWLTKCGALPAGTRIRGGAGTGITGQGSALDY